MENNKLLEIQNLQTNFLVRGFVARAVDDVSLSITTGQTLGLVGESGCGKSVTALSILRLLPKRSTLMEGNIHFSGMNMLTANEEALLKIRGNSISMIFQEPMTSLNPVMTIGDQIAEVFVLHQSLTWNQGREKAVEMLERVQIPSPRARSKDYPHSLSGGMRQRAMIAMALSCQPTLLLADEPTTALDVTIQAQIMDLMLRLKEKLNTAILLITHDLGLIAETVSRVIVMYAGQIVEESPVRDLFKEPLHPYTRGLMGSVPKLGQKFKGGPRDLDEIKGVVPSLLNLPAGCRFNPRCPLAIAKCCEQTPGMVSIGRQRQVRCWLAGGAK